MGMQDDQTFSTSSTTGTIGRRRRTLFIGAILLLVIAVVAITLGVVLGKDSGVSSNDSKSTGGGGNTVTTATPAPNSSPTPPPSTNNAPTTLAPVTGAPVTSMPNPPTAPANEPSQSPSVLGASVTPTPPPITPSPAETKAPVTLAPVTLAPVTPVPSITTYGSPSAGPVTYPPALSDAVDTLIRSVAIFGGAEFDALDSYQSKALRWLKRDAFTMSWSDGRLIQRYALACVYFSTNSVRHIWTDYEFGDGVIYPWYNETKWLSSASECEWFRVECSFGSSVVDELLLYQNRLTGSFPREVTLLSSVNRIDLFDNFVWNEGDEGNAWLGEMTSLRYLFYGNTYFEYDGIPPQISDLVNLIEYDCSYTLYYGELVDTPFVGLNNLNYLVLSGNVYQSSLPPAVVNLPSLEYLYVADTTLTGTMDFILDMPLIFEVWFGYNEIEGSMPTEIGLVTTLGSLSATWNLLTGTIPTEIGTLQLMQQLWLSNNTITGQIPSELGSLGALTILDLVANELSGAVPEQICALPLMTFEADCDLDCNCCTTNCLFA